MTSYLNAKKINRKKKLLLVAVTAFFLGSGSLAFAHDHDHHKKDKGKVKKIVFIHTGDFHGDLDPHVNLRAGSSASEGGLARVATVVKKIRKKHKKIQYMFTPVTLWPAVPWLHSPEGKR